VLLDEIEKAHPDVFNLLLQVMDEGRLTDSNGRTVSFRNTIVIMTSNVGSRELDEYGSGVGFNTSGKNISINRKNVLEKAVRKAFPPEFINRVDEQVFFNPLTKDDIGNIIDIELKGLKKRVSEAGFELRITPAAKRFVADEGYDPNYGARPLKRAIQRYIEDPVSEHIIAGRILAGKKGIPHSRIRVSMTKDKDSTLVEWI
jgi:ATP-dependent Clp protease ATP-binding subunit ClpC